METLIMTILPSLCVSIIMVFFNRRQAERDKKTNQKEEQRKSSEQAQLSLLLATAKLSYAVAMAIKNGHPNGEVEEGVIQYKDAIDEFKKFERKLVVEKSSER